MAADNTRSRKEEVASNLLLKISTDQHGEVIRIPSIGRTAVVSTGKQNTNKLCGLNLRTNYTERATTASRRS
jgi:hypothetical protein